MVDLERIEEADWIYRSMKKDKGEKWQLRVALVAFASFVVVYVWPMIWRMFR